MATSATNPSPSFLVVTTADASKDKEKQQHNDHQPSSNNHNHQDFELRSVSVRLDGRESIEHQIDIHVLDLAEVAGNPDIGLLDVLHGLKYVMDYRIRGGKMRHLNADLMTRLLETLLQNMAHEEGSMLKKRPTEGADLAFTLFGEFVEEVEEFRRAVSLKSATDLCHALKIHRRCQPWSSKSQRQDAAGILNLLTTHFPKFEDWRELVKSDEHDDAEKLIAEYKSLFQARDLKVIMPPVDEDLFPPPSLYFDKNPEKLAMMYGSHIQTGLPSSRIEELAQHYGPNKLPDPPKASALKMLWTQLTDFMIIILICAAVIEFIMDPHDPAAPIVLLIVVVLNVIIGFSQEYKANKALEALSTLSVPKATVIRDGKQEVIDSVFLVPGDLVVLEEGEAVPADLRLCEVSQLEVVEAILTGESVATQKSVRTIRKKTRKLPLGDCKGNAFMTTVVARGRGKGIVVRTGEQTEIGRISKAITSTPHVETPIQKKLKSLGIWLVILAITLCIIVVAIRFLKNLGRINPDFTKKSLSLGISLAVSVIPEGLVAVTIVTMALAVGRLAVRKAIVRKLPSVETLGSVTHICSDKTGTLTEGKMGASQLWTSDNSLFHYNHPTPTDKGSVSVSNHTPLTTSMSTRDPLPSEPRSTCPLDPKAAPPHLVISKLISTLCNNAVITTDPDTNTTSSSGDPTEIAMIGASLLTPFTREWFQTSMAFTKIGEYAFDSDRKLMSVIYKQTASPSDPFLSVGEETGFVLAKGAPEGILHRCTGYLSADTKDDKDDNSFINVLKEFKVEPLNEDYVEYISKRNLEMASSGLRVLALAIRKVGSEEAARISGCNKNSEAEKELVFVGLIGLIDPPKHGVKESIATCKRAGVKVIMITGDHVATASAIAKQLGIMDPDSSHNNRAMKGIELDQISEEALAELRPFPVVFARVSPDNKLKIVRALQSKDFIVAMTGDGVNDAPAIKKADVGIAMGIGGTEITKQAADIVLADDNFCTIAEAVKEGRQVFDNIKKFIVYLLSCNVAEILLFLISTIVFESDVPLSIMQILWSNIIADVPPAMSLGLEPAEKNVMSRPPRPPKEGVLTLPTICVILFQGLIQSLASFTVFYVSKDMYTAASTVETASDIGKELLMKRQTFTFATLTTMQLMQSFSSRSVELSIFVTGITENRWMILAFGISMSSMFIAIYVPGINNWLGFIPFLTIEWAYVLVCVVLQIALIEFMKFGVRRYNSYTQSKNKREY